MWDHGNGLKKQKGGEAYGSAFSFVFMEREKKSKHWGIIPEYVFTYILMVLRSVKISTIENNINAKKGVRARGRTTHHKPTGS